MKKQYNQKTPIFGIPVLGYKDRIIPEVELYRYTVIENLLIAGMQGVRECVFDDGMFRIVEKEDGTYDVTLSATNASPSAEGIVSGAYFKAESQIRWKDLKKDNRYWLYLRGTTKTFVDSTSLRMVIARKEMAEQDNQLLMAVVNLREQEPEVDAYPDGKVYSKDIAKHVNDKENPHGRRLYQDELVVREKLTLRNLLGESPVIEVDGLDGEPVEFPASALPGAIAELAGRVVEVVDFESFGPEGGVLKVPNRKKILNVTVTRRVVGELTGLAGEVAVGYFGEDEKADIVNEFVVYNTGQEGLPMKAMVLCG